MALRRGIQSALFRLGCTPEYVQTDHSTAATHNLKTGKRGFNKDYENFVHHFGMKARTTAIGKSNQNGDIESANNALKKCLKQHLILRGSSDFESVEAYEKWLWKIIAKNNAVRTKRVSEELLLMKKLSVSRLREHKDETVRVSRESTIRVMQNTYSVPSRLSGEKVKVRIFDERLELFPSLVFRTAYDRLNDGLGVGYQADREYLRVLHHAAAVSESDVETALELLLATGELPLADEVKSLVEPRQPEASTMKPYDVELNAYDALLPAMGGQS